MYTKWWQQRDVEATSTSSFSSKMPKMISGSSVAVYLVQLEDHFKLASISSDVDKICVVKAGLPSEEYKRTILDFEPPTMS